MEANELRMFNAIKRFGQIVYVNEHTFEDVKINNGSYSPIELTEDWLLKMPKDLIIPDWIKNIHTLQNWYYYENKCQKELEFT